MSAGIQPCLTLRVAKAPGSGGLRVCGTPPRPGGFFHPLAGTIVERSIRSA